MEVTALLKAWGAGDPVALDRLAPAVYDELHCIARHYMKNERRGGTMQATALVHEAYLKLVDVQNVDWEHRGQFFAIAAQMMRRILIDSARARRSRKRGGEVEKLTLDEDIVLTPAGEHWIMELDTALADFQKLAPRQAKVVELRYFGGLDTEEIAAIMKISTRTVDRDWQFAKSWLMRELTRTS